MKEHFIVPPQCDTYFESSNNLFLLTFEVCASIPFHPPQEWSQSLVESPSFASSGAIEVVLRFLLFVLCLALAIWLVVPSWAPPTLIWLLVYEWSMISFGVVLFSLLRQDTLCKSRLNLSGTYMESHFLKSGTLLQGLERQVFNVVMSHTSILSMVFGSAYAVPM